MDEKSQIIGPQSNLINRSAFFPMPESQTTNDSLVKNMIEIGDMIARSEESNKEKFLEGWANAHIDGLNYFKGGVFLSSSGGTIPSIVIQRYGTDYSENFVHDSNLSSYWGCLAYYSDGYLAANFTKAALPKGVVFPSADKLLIEKYAERGAIIKSDNFVASVFKIGDLENETLKYLRDFSKEALKTFKQPLKMS